MAEALLFFAPEKTHPDPVARLARSPTPSGFIASWAETLKVERAI